jgi:hypothetical protein
MASSLERTAQINIGQSQKNEGLGSFTSTSLFNLAQKVYQDCLGAVKSGNIFSLDVGPDYEGKLREIDVKTLHEVGEIICEEG